MPAVCLQVREHGCVREVPGLSKLLNHVACLQVAQVGDALAASAAVEGGSAGIIVDLFADGQLIPQLTQVRSNPTCAESA
jgi:hypothetical protein